MNDRELFQAGYNRVYDSLEPETNLDHVEEVVDLIYDAWNAEEVVCSYKVHHRIADRHGYAEWFTPEFQEEVLARIRRVVEKAGRRCGVGPEGFSWLANY